MSLLGRLRASFRASVGDIFFGMEDGTVSIFGLVFGVALSAPDSQAVLLAGATGAAAAAVSMMAGSHLDAESERDAARAQAMQPAPQRAEELAATADRIVERLGATGGLGTQADALRHALATTPSAIAAIRQDLAPTNSAKSVSPTAHALWMFVAGLFAGAIPVIPFVLLPLVDARVASLAVTSLLLLALGVGHGLVAGRNILRTTLETFVVAAAAATAGVAIGRLIT